MTGVDDSRYSESESGFDGSIPFHPVLFLIRLNKLMFTSTTPDCRPANILQATRFNVRL